MVGGSGTAKTTTALMYFDSLTNDSMMVKRINFSSATTAGMFQSTIEGELDKRGGKNFGPPSGCGMTVFLDDVSMPEVREKELGVCCTRHNMEHAICFCTR